MHAICKPTGVALDMSKKNGQATGSPKWKNIIEVRFSPLHPLFELGGRSGNVVNKLKQPDLKYHQSDNNTTQALWETDEALDVEVRVEKGWKVVACDGIIVEGPEVMRAAEKAKKKGLDCVIAFEISEMNAKGLGYKRVAKSTERFELKHKLGNKSLSQLGELSESEKKTYLTDPRVMAQIVDSAAVFETEVLLGKQSGKSMQQISDMFTAAKRGDFEFLEKALKDPELRKKALLQRDGDGNVMLHHVANAECAKLLIDAEPLALGVKNKKGRTPMQTFLARHPDQMWPGHEVVEQFFSLDGQGLSAAMRTEGATREKMKSLVPPWSDFMAALATDVHNMQSALQALHEKSGVPWKDGLAFHLFGEAAVWQNGQHTKLSRQRLGSLWKALECGLEGVRRRDDGGEPGPVVKLTRMLLEASRGPNHASLDPREPYRKTLLAATEQLEAKSAEGYAAVCRMEQNAYPEEYAKLQSVRSYFPGKEAVTPDSIWKQLGLEPELRHDLQIPSWISNPDLDSVFKDLQTVGAVGQSTHGDAAYDLLQLAYADQDADAMLQLDKGELAIARWHAAWVRGMFQGHLKHVTEAIESACLPKQPPTPFCSKLCEKLVSILTGRTKVKGVGDGCQDDLKTESQVVQYTREGLPGPEKLCHREEGKSLIRICEKVVDILKKWGTKLEESCAGDTEPELAKNFLMTSSTFVLDILGSTFIADSTSELVEVYERLTKIKRIGNHSKGVAELVGVPGVFNGFASDFQPKGGYRDIKLWIEVRCPSNEPHGAQQSLLVETQLLLRGLFDEKHWSHLPYELRRGSFDWGHLKDSWSSG